MTELRPIGTRFFITYPPMNSSNNPHAHTYEYEIIEHVDVELNGKAYKKESIKAISVREYEYWHEKRKTT